jgi:hypothetical protein
LYHGFISCGVTHLEHLRVEEMFKWVDLDGFEVGRWLRLSVESHQSVPGNTVVVKMTIRDEVLSGGSRNKEGELRSLQYRLISEEK